MTADDEPTRPSWTKAPHPPGPPRPLPSPCRYCHRPLSDLSRWERIMRYLGTWPVHCRECHATAPKHCVQCHRSFHCKDCMIPHHMDTGQCADPALVKQPRGFGHGTAQDLYQRPTYNRYETLEWCLREHPD